jgi:signal transduction histidine kinase
MYVAPILRNARRLQRLAKNLLDLSRLENQSLTLNKEIFDLSELISDAVDDLIPSIRKKYQNLKVVKPTSTVFVYADKERITQVVFNLLSNAIKFTKDGVILVDAEKRIGQRDVVITIKDSGLGINPSVLPILFSKFVSTSPEGLGLGLFITKNIIEAHGGRIWAHNNDGDRGATFRFTLPL